MGKMILDMRCGSRIAFLNPSFAAWSGGEPRWRRSTKRGLPKVTVMGTLTVTAKSQVTLRQDLLKHLGVHPGEKIFVDKLPDGRIELKAARPTGTISDVFDFLKRDGGPRLSVEEINEIAARGWAGDR